MPALLLATDCLQNLRALLFSKRLRAEGFARIPRQGVQGYMEMRGA